MYSAKQMSDAIRMKRKSMKEEVPADMVDTAPRSEVGPNDILNNKYDAQIHETLDLPVKSSAPSDPADAELGDSQKESALKKKMARIAKILGSLSVG